MSSAFLYSSPFVFAFTKISYDTIFYGNRFSSNVVAATGCYFGAVKITEIVYNLYKLGYFRFPTITFPAITNYDNEPLIDNDTIAKPNNNENNDDLIDINELEYKSLVSRACKVIGNNVKSEIICL